ncbi:MAG TPA: methyltransferase [Thermodesulfobacteriota bacterium]|nr:methyltransferase [Thermodesulfobacteriota bacterium]
MRVGVIRTAASPCRCAESVSRGLESLGHEAVVADSEEIEFNASSLALNCDLVIDHTDTYRERGLLRVFVRLLLEARGARVVGSGAGACLAADDKFAAKSRLGESGIPCPPGILVHSREFEIPEWLPPPWVVKPVFEHMSRGLKLTGNPAEAAAAVRESIDRGRSVLLETFIPGREFAVSLLGGPKGVEVLPVLEWRPDDSSAMLTEEFKLTPVSAGRRDAVQAELPAAQVRGLEALARRAFDVLHLRDYARFDVRLSPGGTFYFLETNTTPSLEPYEALALSAKWAGLDYPAMVDRMLSAALARRGERRGGEETIELGLPAGAVKLIVPPGVHKPPQSTIDLAGLLDVKKGESVLELGCGSGLLSVAAAKSGAGRVVATDIDPRSLEAAARNVRANGVGGRVEIRAGSWYEAAANGKFDVVIATPPQTPGPFPFSPRWGGGDGTKHLRSVVEGAPKFLNPGGRLWMLAISLANPAALMGLLAGNFSDFAVVRESERRFHPGEYEEMMPGLFTHLLALRSSGKSEFQEAGGGLYAFRNLFIRAWGPRFQ